MRTNRNVWRAGALAAVTVFVLVIGQSIGQAQQGNQIIQRLNEKYASLSALRAEFVQEVSSPYRDGFSRMSGTLLLSGDRYRIETEHQDIVTDGVTTWVYNKPENQVLVANHEENEDFVSPSTFFTGYSDHYEATYSGRENVDGTAHHVVKLAPRQRDAFVREVTLWVRDADTIITRLRVEDINETVMDFQLRDINLNPAVQSGAFTFTAPAGAEVVDLRN